MHPSGAQGYPLIGVDDLTVIEIPVVFAVQFCAVGMISRPTVKPFTASGPEPRVNGATGAFQPRVELAFTGSSP